MQFPRAVGYSFSAHAALVAVILVTGLWRGCTSEPPGEQLLIMEVLPLADTAPQQKPEDLLPAPPELLPPTPAPPKPVDDVPIPDPIPDPKPKQKPKPVIERSQTRIRRDPQPTAKPLSRQQIRDQLSRGLPAASFGRPSDFPAWYFSYVRQTLYDTWIQPSGLSAASGLKVDVKLRVLRDGTISQKTITHRSGNSVLDQSVQEAIDATSRLRPLPDTYRGDYRDITVSFALTGI